MPLPTSAPHRIPATGTPQVRLINKAGQPQMAVYDEAGKLVGWIDPAKLQPVAPAPGQAGKPGHAEIEANAQRVQQQSAAADVQKAMGQLLHAVPPLPRTPGQLRKAAGSLSEQYDALLKTVGDSRADAIRRTVGLAAIKLMIAGAAKDKAAVNIAKRAAVTYAVNKDLI